ncbi:MAG: type II toxin-antitoxin system toxin MazF [Methylobacter sp.]
MTRRRIAQRGDVYWIDPNPIAGREIKDRHRFVVITPKEINALGIAMTVPISSGGAFARDMGLTVAITGHDTVGVAVCNQVCSFDIEARERADSARFVETLDLSTVEEIVNRVLSVIDPAV